jgi:hypothetical protein
MITLERLVELRCDEVLNRRLLDCVRAASNLVADTDNVVKRLQNGGPRNVAVREAQQIAQASMLAVYEEARRPLIELLRDIDTSAVVPPHLHARLKEFLKGSA